MTQGEFHKLAVSIQIEIKLSKNKTSFDFDTVFERFDHWL